jgi:hypothetical protein
MEEDTAGTGKGHKFKTSRQGKIFLSPILGEFWRGLSFFYLFFGIDILCSTAKESGKTARIKEDK